MSLPKHFFWIDALRGLAAFAVLFAHYHHFYLADFTGRPSLPDAHLFPYGGVLYPLYEYGHLAVQLFWTISGFVFTHVYLHRETNGRRFFVARFARLYPLHFATLILVAVIQIASLTWAGHWQIYGNNDLRHFVAHLLFSSNWSTQTYGLSFNGPIWSVSLEIIVYVMFFMLVCWARLRALWAALILALGCGAFALLHPFDIPLIRIGVITCATYFFWGAVLYHVVVLSRGLALGLAVLTGGLGVWLFGSDPELIGILLIASALILTCALADFSALPAPAPLRFLGDTSYSLYLVHVPIQMLWLMLADIWFDGSRAFANSAVTLPIYIVIAVLIAGLAHYRFERPAGAWLRKHLS